MAILTGWIRAEGTADPRSPDLSLSIEPKNKNLVVLDNSTHESETLTPGTLRKTFGNKGKNISVSYGKDLGGSISIIVLASRDNSDSVILSAFNYQAEMWAGSAITITPTSNYTKADITRMGAGKAIIADKNKPTFIKPKSPTITDQPVTPPPSQKYSYSNPSLRADQVLPEPPPPPKNVEPVKTPLVVELPKIEKEPEPPQPPTPPVPPKQPEPEKKPTVQTQSTPTPEKPLGPTAPEDIESKDRLPFTPALQAAPPPPNAIERVKKTLAYTNALYEETLEMSEALQKYLQNLKDKRYGTDTAPNLSSLLAENPPSAKVPDYTSLEEANAELKRKQILIEKLGLQIRDLQRSIREASDRVSDPEFAMTPSVPSPMKETATKATAAFNEGDYPLAIKYYDSILDNYPNSLYALSNLGVVYFTQKNYGEAEKYLRRALKNCPFDAFSSSILGIVYFQQGRPEDALQILCRSLSISPKNPDALNYLSLACSELGWDDVAEVHLLKAIEINPKHAEAQHNLAVLYATQNPPSPNLARKHYEIAKSLGMPQNKDLEKLLADPPSATTK